jgi:hypothetical protein
MAMKIDQIVTYDSPQDGPIRATITEVQPGGIHAQPLYRVRKESGESVWTRPDNLTPAGLSGGDDR